MEGIEASVDTSKPEAGLWPLPVRAAARLLWLAAERPDALGRTHLLLSMSDWLNLRPHGVAATEPSQKG